MYVDTKESISVTPSPSLRNLAYVLRHEELWPTGFTWNYRYTDCCGMGISQLLWGVDVGCLPDVYTYFRGDLVYNLFCKPLSWFKMPFRTYHARMVAVTPEMVADRIDRYLKAQ
jgi:hypothetical protein